MNMKWEGKFTSASKSALVGGLLILLNPYLTIGFWLGRPGTGYGIAPFYWLIVTNGLVCGVIIMICAAMANFKPRFKAAFGAATIACSLLSSWFFLRLLPLLLGNVLGVIGGLWITLGGKGETETKKLSKEEHEELSEEEYEKLMEETDLAG